MNRIIDIFTFPLILVLMFVNLGAHIASPKEIDVIYIWRNGFGCVYSEYKIDLKNQRLWSYSTYVGDGYVPRDPTADNQGFAFVRTLDGCKIKAFRCKAALYGVENWEDYYASGMIIEDYWYVKLVFADGATKLTYGNSSAYPSTGRLVHRALKRLTGEDLLILKF